MREEAFGLRQLLRVVERQWQAVVRVVLLVLVSMPGLVLKIQLELIRKLLQLLGLISPELLTPSPILLSMAVLLLRLLLL